MLNTTIVQQPVNLSTLVARYTQAAIDFIQMPSRAPFLLYVAYDHVHSPQFASGAWRGVSARGMFGDAVEEMDASVGAIVDSIRSNVTMARNTLIIFTSVGGDYSAFLCHLAR